MKTLNFIFLLIILLSFACSKKTPDPDPQNAYVLGQNIFTIEVDGDMREYYVHVPSGYEENNPTPVVFMLHGTGGDGEGNYISSGWAKLGDEENIITVFPTSWHYCFTNVNTGSKFDQTLWHSYKNQFELCENETYRDDVKFLRQIISELSKKLKVDAHRIYMVGFSSGAMMAYRCAVEMSDVLAAVVESGASHYLDTIYTPVRNLPITFQLGNADNSWLDGAPAIPMIYFDSLLTNYWLFKNIIRNHTGTFDCEPTYNISGDSSDMLIATFNGIPDVGNRNFHFVLINGLEHKYPNGVNHKIIGAEQNWEWMKQFIVP